MARPKSKTKKILFAVEIIVLLLFIGGLYVYGQLNSKLDKINQPVLDDSKIKVNQEVQDSIDSQESTLTGYTTYNAEYKSRPEHQRICNRKLQCADNDHR